MNDKPVHQIRSDISGYDVLLLFSHQQQKKPFFGTVWPQQQQQQQNPKKSWELTKLSSPSVPSPSFSCTSKSSCLTLIRCCLTRSGSRCTAHRSQRSFSTILGGAGVFGAYGGGPNAITQRENVCIYIYFSCTYHISYHIITNIWADICRYIYNLWCCSININIIYSIYIIYIIYTIYILNTVSLIVYIYTIIYIYTILYIYYIIYILYYIYTILYIYYIIYILYYIYTILYIYIYIIFYVYIYYVVHFK